MKIKEVKMSHDDVLHITWDDNSKQTLYPNNRKFEKVNPLVYFGLICMFLGIGILSYIIIMGWI